MARFSLPWREWPDADRAMWDAMVRRGAPLDESGALSHLRKTTVEMLSTRYSRWLAWLRSDALDVLAEEPWDRCTVARLSAWLASMETLAPTSRLMFLDGTVRVLRSASPELDWTVHHRLLRLAANETRNEPSSRKRGRIKSSSVLLDAALDLAGAQAAAATTDLEAAKRRRDGTMIAVLAMLPMRRRAFAELALGSSVCVTANSIDIVLSAEMTKNGVVWEAPVHGSIEPLLRRYIEEVRPLLLARAPAPHDYLWIGNNGAPFSPNHVTRRVGQITSKLFGVAISPHLFRDAAATSLARLSPKDALLIRPLLGHASFRTTERHYIHATGIEAGREYAKVLAELLGEGT